MKYRSEAALCLASLFILASACDSESSDNKQTDAAATKDASPDQAADTAGIAVCTNMQTQGSQCTGDFSCRIGALACHCGQPAWCGGAAPPIDFPTRPKQIVCVAPAPIGCPAVAPLAGSSCSVANLSCSYGTCGFDKAQCKNGQWERMFFAPP